MAMDLIEEALAANPKVVEEIKAGKEKGVNRLVGYVLQRDKSQGAETVVDAVRTRLGLPPIVAQRIADKIADKTAKYEEERAQYKIDQEKERRRPIYVFERYFENVGPDQLTSDYIRDHGVDVGFSMIRITGGLNSYGEGTAIDVTFKKEDVLTLEGRKKLYALGVPKDHVVYYYETWWTSDGPMKWREELDGK